MKYRFLRVVALCAMAHSLPGFADDKVRADSHAPLGVMADHVHARGEWMFSYRFMTMDMDGNRQGTGRVSPDTIVTTEANPFFGRPMQPPTLRVVPLDMRMDMHMFGLMYAPSERVTLMAMANYIQKEMEHATYQGASGTTVLGNFTTKSRGFGDTSLLALVSLLNKPDTKLHMIAGLSLPTGATDESDSILTPMNMRPEVRLPYPMQLGSGTVDPVLGASFQRSRQSGSWGAQWRSVLRFSDNGDDYQLGSEHRLNFWAAYLWRDGISTSLRVEHSVRDNIDGADPNIVAPVQTADPDRQKVRRTDFGLGMNLALGSEMHGYRLAFEYLLPLQQDFSGPQLETDAQFIIGLQKAW